MKSGRDSKARPSPHPDSGPPLPWREVAAYIRNEILHDPGEPILEDTPLLSSGLLDSYSMVELVHYVESRCAIEVPPRWHRLEHWDSLALIARTVRAIQRERGSAER